METYSFLRAFADSYMLAVMFTFFIGVVVWVFLPMSRKRHEDSAGIPFRHEDRPAAAHDRDDAREETR